MDGQMDDILREEHKVETSRNSRNSEEDLVKEATKLIDLDSEEEEKHKGKALDTPDHIDSNRETLDDPASSELKNEKRTLEGDTSDHPLEVRKKLNDTKLLEEDTDSELDQSESKREEKEEKKKEQKVEELSLLDRFKRLDPEFQQMAIDKLVDLDMSIKPSDKLWYHGYSVNENITQSNVPEK